MKHPYRFLTSVVWRKYRRQAKNFGKCYNLREELHKSTESKSQVFWCTPNAPLSKCRRWYGTIFILMMWCVNVNQSKWLSNNDNNIGRSNDICTQITYTSRSHIVTPRLQIEKGNRRRTKETIPKLKIDQFR